MSQADTLAAAPAIQRFRPTDAVDDVVAALQADGGAIVEDLLGERLARINTELDPYVEAQRRLTERGGRPLDGIQKANQVGVTAVLEKSLVAREVVLEPMVLSIADRVLLPNCASYQLNGAAVNHLGPGTPAQEIHRDDSYYPMIEPRCELLLVLMWALSDFTCENGATLFVPGSHRWDDARRPIRTRGRENLNPVHWRRAREDEKAYAEMPAGSCLVFLGSALHGSSANLSVEHRRGLYMAYSLGWLRTEENMFLAYPPDVARAFPEKLQRLIGYETYGGGQLGWAREYGLEPCENILLSTV